LTALYRAAENGHVAVVRPLLEHKADVNTKIEYGSTALCRAAENGREAVVRLLLEHKADVDAKDNYMSTTLYWA
jgi:ankyrin repeat protein